MNTSSPGIQLILLRHIAARLLIEVHAKDARIEL